MYVSRNSQKHTLGGANDNWNSVAPFKAGLGYGTGLSSAVRSPISSCALRSTLRSRRHVDECMSRMCVHVERARVCVRIGARVRARARLESVTRKNVQVYALSVRDREDRGGYRRRV